MLACAVEAEVQDFITQHTALFGGLIAGAGSYVAARTTYGNMELSEVILGETLPTLIAAATAGGLSALVSALLSIASNASQMIAHTYGNQGSLISSGVLP